MVNVAEAKPSRNEGEGLPQAVANITLEIIKNSQTEGSSSNSLMTASTVVVVAIEINLPKFKNIPP